MNYIKKLFLITFSCYFYNCENPKGKDLTDIETLKKELKVQFEVYKDTKTLNIDQNEFRSIKEEFADLNNDNLTDAVLFYEYTTHDGFSLWYEALIFINKGTSLNFTTKYKDTDLDFIATKNNEILIHKIKWEDYKSSSYPLIKKEITLTLINNQLEKKVKEKDISLERKFLKRKAYVLAENGLLCREVPNGTAIHKFPYGTEIEVIEMTNQKLSVMDDGKEIHGEWVKVNINNSDKKGYIFDGFIGSKYKLTNLPKKILAFPIDFIKSNEKKAILLPNIHKTYNEQLEEIGKLKINIKTEVKLLEKTKYKRQLIENQDYCKWANYVKVSYNNKEYIVFGKQVLVITAEDKISLSTKEIIFVRAKNHVQEATDEDGLTFCNEIGGDYTNIFIKENDTFHDPKFGLSNDDGIGEYLGDLKVHNDVIKASISQGFQEGTGSFDVEFYYNNVWKSKTSNHKRNYNEPNN